MRYHNVFWDASNCCFTSIELRQVIELLKRPEFNPAEINNNLHDRHLQFAEFAIKQRDVDTRSFIDCCAHLFLMGLMGFQPAAARPPCGQYAFQVR
jgi:hypothetical protein